MDWYYRELECLDDELEHGDITYEEYKQLVRELREHYGVYLMEDPE